MFCKEDRCEWWEYHPLVETRGYKMLDVIDNQCIVILKTFHLINIYFKKLCGKCRLVVELSTKVVF